MTAWTLDDLVRFGEAHEVQIAGTRRDGSLRTPVIVWTVRVGDDLYTRSVNGRDASWFRGVRLRNRGQLVAGGKTMDVDFEDTSGAVDDAIEAVYHAKYDRYPGPVTSITSDVARATTLTIVPHQVIKNPMQVIPGSASTKGPAEMFAGDVYFDVIARGEEPSRMRVNTVRFAPRARTAWHTHAYGQALHVTDGVGLVQSRGGSSVVMRPVTPSTRRPVNGTGTARRPRSSRFTWRRGRPPIRIPVSQRPYGVSTSPTPITRAPTAWKALCHDGQRSGSTQSRRPGPQRLAGL